jgi:hypothetical protein
LPLHGLPTPGELLETDELPGQWLVATVDSGDAHDLGVVYEVAVESAEGVSD